MAYGRIYRQDQFFHLNGYTLSGVQSVSFDVQYDKPNINIFGIGSVGFRNSNLPTYTSNIDSLMVNNFDFREMIFSGLKNELLDERNEEFFSYTGFYSMKNKYLQFSGHSFIQKFSIDCSIGQLVSNNYSLAHYGELITGNFTGTFLQISGSPYFEIKIPTFQSVKVSFDNPNFDRIVGFSYSLDIPREPLYGVGSRYPLGYQVTFPITETISMNLELDKLRFQEVKEKLCNYKEDISLEIQTVCDQDLIKRYDFKDCYLTSQSVVGSIDGNVILTLEYKKNLFEHEIDQIFNNNIGLHLTSGQSGEYLVYKNPEVRDLLHKVGVYYMPVYQGGQEY